MVSELKNEGWNVHSLLCLAEQYSQVTSNFKIPGVGETNEIPFCHGLKTGSPEAGEIFNALVDKKFEPVVLEWERKSYGVKLDNLDCRLTHMWWVDNLWIFAKSQHEWTEMVKDTT